MGSSDLKMSPALSLLCPGETKERGHGGGDSGCDPKVQLKGREAQERKGLGMDPQENLLMAGGRCKNCWVAVKTGRTLGGAGTDICCFIFDTELHVVHVILELVI